MKLSTKPSTAVAKLTSGKVKVLSTLGGLALAAVAMTVATSAAKAQVAFGVEVGGPRYYAPAPRPVVVAPRYGGYGYADGYWEHRRYEDWRAQQWREREHFDHRFHGDHDRGYPARGWR